MGERICKDCGKAFRINKCRSLRCPSCKNHRHKERSRALVQEVKSRSPCVLCGESNPIVLQAHHVDPTTKWRKSRNAQTLSRISGVSGVISCNQPIKVVIEELEKCVMLCANCHLLVEAGVKSVEGVPLIQV